MENFIVDVKRSGYNRETDDEITIYGTFPLKANDLASAKIEAEKTLHGASIMEPMQTIDPRIDWEEDMPDGYSFVDFSFEIDDVIPDEFHPDNDTL